MKLALHSLLAAAFAVFFVTTLSAADSWQAGVAKTVITPVQPLWMAGYGSRTSPNEGKRTDLFAKALVLDDGRGNRGAIITLDLVGIDRDFSLALCKRLEEEHGLARAQIALCTSHTHSGPVVGKNLGPLHYWVLDDGQRKMIDAYAETLREKIVAVTGEAIAALAPARLQSGSGKCTFAVNRRNNKPYPEVPALREKGALAGPVDHDVPVLSVRDPDGTLKAVLFGYACHATVLQANEWNADYPGYAQAALEANHPGAVALFWAGCGGDQNPLPRSELPLAEKYGAELARAVDDVLKAPMPELAPALATHYREIKAPLATPPTREELAANEKSPSRFEVARAKLLLRRMEAKGAIDGQYPYPIGQWTLGEHIDFIFLGGEVVVDYALRLKRERKGTRTWVAGYANDVMAYIPSLRVLKEGGYEGGGSNVYYGLPALWAESIEETIVKATHQLAAAPAQLKSAGAFESIIAPATDASPRNSEGDITILEDGTLLAAWSEFYGGSRDDSPARLSGKRSTDGGRTWGERFTIRENSAANIMSVSFLQLDSGELLLFYLERHTRADLDGIVCRSTDKGRTWSTPALITPEDGYFVMNNARVVQLRDGRIVAPFAVCDEVWKKGHVFRTVCYFSDDTGRTWQRGKDECTAPKRGAMEPGLIEKADGTLLQYFRTQTGTQWFAESQDGGDTWSKAKPWSVVSPESPATVAPLPGDHGWLVVHNPSLNPENSHGGERTPLVAAVSKDEGATWTAPKMIESDPAATYAYTSIDFHEGRALLTYYLRPGDSSVKQAGKLSWKFKSLPLDWFAD